MLSKPSVFFEIFLGGHAPKPPYSGNAPLGKDGGDEGVGENCVNVTEGGREGGRKEGTKKKGGGGAPTPLHW